MGSRKGRCADCGAREASDQEFLEVVVHNAPSLSVLDVAQEPISRLRQGRRSRRVVLTEENHFVFLRAHTHTRARATRNLV